MWFLTLWGWEAGFAVGIALFLAVLCLAMIAIEGKDAVDPNWLTFLGLFALGGIAFPLLLLLPFIGIYRAIKD